MPSGKSPLNINHGEEGSFKIVTLNLPTKNLEFIQDLVKEGQFSSRSEFIRTAVKFYLHKVCLPDLDYIKKYLEFKRFNEVHNDRVRVPRNGVDYGDCEEKSIVRRLE